MIQSEKTRLMAHIITYIIKYQEMLVLSICEWILENLPFGNM